MNNDYYQSLQIMFWVILSPLRGDLYIQYPPVAGSTHRRIVDLTDRARGRYWDTLKTEIVDHARFVEMVFPGRAGFFIAI